jgi:hypothetical protein
LEATGTQQVPRSGNLLLRLHIGRPVERFHRYLTALLGIIRRTAGITLV